MSCNDPKEALLRTLQAPRRNRYFYGKRLDVQHMQMEQDHGQHKQWMLNRLTVGKGVVCGLHVDIDSNRLCVSPGMAIDGLGREIVVPVRACIDPFAPQGCDCTPGVTPAPAPTPAPTGTPSIPTEVPSVPGAAGAVPVVGGGAAIGSAERPTSEGPGDLVANPARGTLATLWLCYHECHADPQATLVSDCNSSATCTPGTTVETFCLKVLPGTPPLQRDPDFCAHLWPKPHTPTPHPTEPPEPPAPGSGDLSAEPAAPVDPTGLLALGRLEAEINRSDATPWRATELSAELDLKDGLRAIGRRRRLLCELFDDPCDAREGDPCVPLAVLRLADGRITHVDSCVVRPRLYSNAQLLDLILCLADKIDDCCGHDKPPAPPAPQPAPLLRVASVDYLRREANSGAEAVITSVADATATTAVPIGRNVNAIRIKFTAPFAQDAHKPTTHGLGDPDHTRHNVQVQALNVLDNLEYVPGTLVIEAADTVRFDLFPDSPYARTTRRGWQKGRYVLYLRGTDAIAGGQPALTDLAGTALDGEATAPTAVAISGDGVAGGDFKARFEVG